MKHARVAYAGAIHNATPHAQGLCLADGRIVAEEAVVWLPPIEPGTVFALGLNYADHVKELSFGKQAEPLVFLKSPQAIMGHKGQTRRPADATHMHYECELAVVIGRTARHLTAENALSAVAGYTVANDFAIRDYLENWYRPNLRVKNRDTCTLLGPWLVDAADIPDPGNLWLRTEVNGQVTQEGSTADMMLNVAEIIAYLSRFMTLSRGDVILTGTPKGVADVQPGDQVTTEIEHLGRLTTHIVGDDVFGIQAATAPAPATS